ncbi:hypothetical protein COW99_02360 [Candidatus Roizmanbacteria bacterium CG22_combo_CG10-13_8_21_14_all_38_20]|uniref:Uncharacterized protein n=1 Tax=Candidatus Roizmanbacteria bacterium CG22_combo_CG10-13_8_21_14_all_38_20 TaxID=1974862 RepID=A0A2H0BVX6_9BACT|nr:hypothetical protein [Candidatus Microgenomates bacterium]PIP61699.1 MAG: hypothetical protein COW99_02360 [Candidatus Roizmanbacteria bacterium CG22_combo_CG10-13_8_21_14_all_38_20]PJC32007.1 MAG: hypothetical protein CO050_00755 [Candidatus Roizmanbacteria bacterium CG_4_9_14_0_2_um_filter_38_17]
MISKTDSKLFVQMYNEVRAEMTRDNRKFRDEVIEAVRDEGKNIVAKVNNNTAKFKDEMVEKLDRIEQELILTQGQSDRINDHEERISALEQSIVS